MVASLFGLGGPELIFLLVFVVFWIWMIVDCLKNSALDEVQRILWVLIILTVPCGCFVYLFARRAKPMQQDAAEFYSRSAMDGSSGANELDPKDAVAPRPCEGDATICERSESVRKSLLIPVVPWVTFALLVVNLLLFILRLNRGLAPQSIDLLSVGLEMVVLCWVGRLIERMWGHLQFLIIYVIAGVGASCMTLLLNRHVHIVVGPSAFGALWGIMASMAVWIILNRRFLPSSRVRSWLRLLLFLSAPSLAIELIRMLSPGFWFISGVGIGGGAFGAAIAVLLHVSRFGRGVWPWLALAGTVALPLLCLATLIWTIAVEK
jgi:hypothetical protein